MPKGGTPSPVIHPMAPHQDESEAEEWLGERPRGTGESGHLLADQQLMLGGVRVIRYQVSHTSKAAPEPNDSDREVDGCVKRSWARFIPRCPVFPVRNREAVRRNLVERTE